MKFNGTKTQWITDLKDYEFSKGNQTIEVWTNGSGNIGNSRWICQVNTNIRSVNEHKEFKSNARLIANAPNLMNVLIEVEKHHQGLHSEIGNKIRDVLKKSLSDL